MVLSADVVGSRKGVGKNGRPRNAHTAAAQASFNKQYSGAELQDLRAYDNSKAVYSSSCQCSKHFRYLACQQVSRSSKSLACRVCQKTGSSYEKIVYNILDKLAAVRAYAVEAYAVQGQHQHADELVNLNRHAYDVLTLQPANMLIEVQGEQHSTKLMRKTKGTDGTLQQRSNKDTALRDGAVEQGCYVLWLIPGNARGRTSRWRSAIQGMLSSIEAKVPAYHACA